MSKILKNTTGSSIVLNTIGIEIPASSQSIIEKVDYLLLASDDSVAELTTLINSGNIVVNDGTDDLTASYGINFIKYPDDAANIDFTTLGTTLTSKNARDAIDEAATTANTAINTPRYTILLTYNGTLSNNEFIGYSNLVPGDLTPIIIPVNSTLEEYTFSNNRTGADYGIELRKNSTTGTVFNSVSKDNTQFFVETNIGESFNQGDQIYIKYLDQGQNARDVGILLTFKSEPV